MLSLPPIIDMWGQSRDARCVAQEARTRRVEARVVEEEIAPWQSRNNAALIGDPPPLLPPLGCKVLKGLLCRGFHDNTVVIFRGIFGFVA